MKIYFTILLLSISMVLNGQNLKKILNQSELDSINQGFEIIKIIDKTNCDNFSGLQGKIMIGKSNKTLDFKYIGDMVTFFDNGNLKSKYVFDNAGLSKTYQEFTNNGDTIYDCTYEYKTINGSIYRLEHLMLYFEPKMIKQDGHRFMIYRNSKGKKINSRQQKYGKWTFYNSNGSVEKIKDYGDIK